MYTPFSFTYQWVDPPKDREVELTSILAARGVSGPTHRQFHYARQVLESRGFHKTRVKGRLEYWAHESYKPRVFEPTYTIEKFTEIFFPGFSRPLSPQRRAEIIVIMRSRGLRSRMGGLYWSPKVIRRSPLRTPVEPLKVKHVRLLNAAFTLEDLLDWNALPHTRAAFAWARQYVRDNQLAKLPGTRRYAKRLKDGAIHPIVTNLWHLPAPVFTTHQFQLANECVRPSAEIWATAVAFLHRAGYKYDPRWKRWMKPRGT